MEYVNAFEVIFYELYMVNIVSDKYSFFAYSLHVKETNENLQSKPCF